MASGRCPTGCGNRADRDRQCAARTDPRLCVDEQYQSGIAVPARANAPTGANQGQGALFSTSADAFFESKALHEEIFGAASLIVRCPDLKAMLARVESLEGQLTTAIHIDEADYADVRLFLPALERRACRVLVNGFGTGVEVAHATVHGGSYPSTADGRSTSVGSLAIRRFLPPVSYQDMPDALLPEALRTSNPWALDRLLDGTMTLAN